MNSYEGINEKASSATALLLTQFGAAPVTGIPVSSGNQTFISTTPIYAPLLHPQPPVPWSSGLCGCGGGITNWCITCFFPFITFGQIAEIVDEGSSSCVSNAAILALIMHFSHLQAFYSCLYRNRLRQLYNLEGSQCGDFLAHFFCLHCALRQEYRELMSRGFDMSIGWHANVERMNHEAVMPPIVHQGMTR